MSDSVDKSTAQVFVCYARADAKRVVPIIENLRQAGIRVWRDIEGIQGSALWQEEIVKAICGSSLVVFFASRRSCGSKNVAKELSIANEENKPILPVFLNNVKISNELRYQLAGIQHIRWQGKGSQSFPEMLSVIRHRVGEAAVVNTPPFPVSELSRGGGQWQRWAPALAAIAVAALAVSAILLLRGRRGSAEPVAPSAPATLPAMEPVAQAVVAPMVMHGTWYIETTTEETDYNPYIGLQIRFRVLLTQNGTEVRVQGEKIGEVRDGELMELTGRGKTPIRLDGHITQTAEGDTAITLMGDEGSTSRDNFSTAFELKAISPDCLKGTFRSTAANSSGRALWISEELWKTSGFAALNAASDYGENHQPSAP